MLKRFFLFGALLFSFFTIFSIGNTQYIEDNNIEWCYVHWETSDANCFKS